MAAQAAVYGIRQALVDVDLSEPTVRSVPPVAELARTVALVDTLRQACDYAGAGRLVPGLLQDLHAASAGSDRRAALRLLCDAAFMASTIVRNLGHPAEAWLAAERCRDAAEAAEDPVLLGYAAFARASAASVCGSFHRSLALAEKASDELQPHLARHGARETLGLLLLVCAYASRGLKRLDDGRAWAAEAAELAERTGETETMSLFFGPTNVNLWRIGIEVDGGDPALAVEIARDTNPATIAAGFRQVFYYADVGRAYARLRGRDREAIRYLLTAERIAPQHFHSSPHARETTRALLERSRRQAGGTELRGLCERMRVG
jgi:tetratricopeptide (TPR) repeat protein